MNPFAQHSKISTVLQLVSIFAIVATFFGFLIVNIYLAFFGFWDFNFLKVQYVSAGALFLLFVSLPTIFFYAFFKAKEILEKYRLQDKTLLKSFLVFIAKAAAFILLACLSLFTFIFPLTLSSDTKPSSFLVFLGEAWIVIIFITVASLIKSHGEIAGVRYSKINLQNIAVYFRAHYRFLYLLLAVPLLVFIFSFFIYPTVPRYFGGGRPVPVTIGFEHSFDSQQIGFSNPFDGFLIYQSDDSLLILTNGGTYQLRQEDIAYIKYLETNAHITALQVLANPKQATTTTP